MEAFVLRARRVESHSLAADRTALTALAKAEIHISLKANGLVVFRQGLPPEEQVESAAACRQAAVLSVAYRLLPPLLLLSRLLPGGCCLAAVPP
ncbi:hypothetical protein [Streptomyces sp. NPDC050856]|uniref:hypothetical protein n=1 Tax=Streptomyces sp. NPDC050856 TaxID=3154939 RepID=UPI0033D901FD